MHRFFLLSVLLAACSTSVDDDSALPGDDDATTPFEPFQISVEVRRWIGNVEGWNVCDTEPTLEYVFAVAADYGQTVTTSQNQSWPIYLAWTSQVQVAVPALGLPAATSGAAYFNPWQDLDIEFCNGADCTTVVSIEITHLPSRGDCISQTVDGVYQNSASWEQSNGENYGVSNMDSPHSSHYSCTDWAPSPACPSNDNPSPQCDTYGCQCNLSAWQNMGVEAVRYNAAATSDVGVSAPWFADRWETGGIHATNDGNTVFRIYSEVSLSRLDMIFRSVIDMRQNWNGQWASIPSPDGWEGPPLFRNSVNEFLAPADGFWPIEWEAAPSAAQADLWMQPIWSTTVLPGGEDGTTDLRHLGFKACGSSVAPITCTGAGCTF